MGMQCKEADLAQQPGAGAVGWCGVVRPATRRGLSVNHGERRRNERLTGCEKIAVIAALGNEMINDGSQGLLVRILRHLARKLRIARRILGKRIEVCGPEHLVEEGAHTSVEATA